MDKRSKAEIFKICSESNADELAKNYKTKELIEMFNVLYGQNIQCMYTKKIDIAYKIWNFYSDEVRTLDLCKNLRR